MGCCRCSSLCLSDIQTRIPNAHRPKAADEDVTADGVALGGGPTSAGGARGVNLSDRV